MHRPPDSASDGATVRDTGSRRLAAVEQVDVVVVGARLAGCAAAAPLARAGRRVVVLDRMGFPSDQLSTHALMPAGTSELAKLGALPHILELQPSRVRWARIMVEGVSALERLRPAADGIDYGVCVPRHLQDVQLVICELVRDAARTTDPDISDLLGRARTPQQIVTASRLARALGAAMWHGEQPRLQTLRRLLPDGRTQLAVHFEQRAGRFRSARRSRAPSTPEPTGLHRQSRRRRYPPRLHPRARQ